MSRKSKAAEFVQAGWDIQVTGRNVLVTDYMKDYAFEKISKLDRFFERIVEVQVIMDIQKLEHRVEIIAKIDNVRIVSRAALENMYASIDIAIDKLTKQLLRYKRRMNEHKSIGHDEVAMQENVYAPSEIELINDEIEDQTISSEVDRYRPHAIVKRETRPLKTLTHSEAIVKMELSGEKFMLFRCEEDRKLKLIYRRDDGNYGIVEPE